MWQFSGARGPHSLIQLYWPFIWAWVHNLCTSDRLFRFHLVMVQPLTRIEQMPPQMLWHFKYFAHFCMRHSTIKCCIVIVLCLKIKHFCSSSSKSVHTSLSTCRCLIIPLWETSPQSFTYLLTQKVGCLQYKRYFKELTGTFVNLPMWNRHQHEPATCCTVTTATWLEEATPLTPSYCCW